MKRILLTGSRYLMYGTHNQAVANAIAEQLEVIPDPAAVTGYRCDWSAHTLVHGAARGADTIAARIARAWGMGVEDHPADWERPCDPLWCREGHRRRRGSTTYCPLAGHRRNQAMVDLGAEVCIAFPLNSSGTGGTWDCVRRAEAAGIPCRVFQPVEAP